MMPPRYSHSLHFPGRGPSLAFLSILVLAVLVAWTWVLDAATADASPPGTFPKLEHTRSSSTRTPAFAGAATLSLAKRSPPELHAAVDPTLLKEALAGESPLRFLVEMSGPVPAESPPPGLNREQGRTWLVSNLQAQADAAQRAIRADLDMRRAQGHVLSYRPFWVFNGLLVIADSDTLLALAERQDVRAIRSDRWQQWVEPLARSEEGALSAANGVEWNIAQIRADLAWSALGLDGQGVTVAIMDTGVDWQHPALQAQYRGYKPGGLPVHEGNWFCTTDEGYLYPVDGHGHGTHVAGIAVGGHDRTGVSIGVAPGAKWIAVKTLSDEGYAYESWIHAAFEWLMAPAGDPALAPDVVNASWGSPDSRDETFRADMQALRAAGIVPVFAAGNSGPASATIGSPASYPEAIAIGATDDQDHVASFSSRGPSPWGEIKPEVSAPGTQIRSSLPGGTYGVESGTSMAAPQVAGVVALVLQGDPALAVEQVEAIVESTAKPLGEPIPNNDTGWGRVDAYQAAAVAVEAGFVAGQVTRAPDHQPLPTAEITAFDHVGERRAVVSPDETGNYRLALPPGQYDLRFEAFGYAGQTAMGLWVQTGVTVTVDANLAPLPSGVLRGQVSNGKTGAPVGANISAMGTPAHTASDPQTGEYSLDLPAGTYDLEVTKNGFRREQIPGILILPGEATRQDLALGPAPVLLLVDSGRWYYGSQIRYFEQALTDRDYVFDTWEIRDPNLDVPRPGDLAPYAITIWSSPLDSPGLVSAGTTISNYLTSGGNLFLTGQDIGYWDGGLSGFEEAYYREKLKVAAMADDAGRSNMVGTPGELFEDLSLPINGPDSAQNQRTPDSIALVDARDAAIVASYQSDGASGSRAGECGSYRALYLAAGLEGLGDESTRAEVMDRALSWLAAADQDAVVDLYPAHQDQIWLGTPAITYTLELRNTGRSADQFGLELSPSAWPASLWDATFTHHITQTANLASCFTQTIGVKVTMPADVAWNVTDVVTLTARSLANPSYTARAAFVSKTPAPILLVDDHRWYDALDAYEAALDAQGLPHDVWLYDHNSPGMAGGPSLRRLNRYRVVLWFTGSDWYTTLSPGDEARLSSYLENGGRLLLSSQDYLYTRGVTDFAQDYLGIASYTEDLTATQVIGKVGSPVGDGAGPYELIYPFTNWSDALKPELDTEIAFWGQHGQPVGLARDRAPWKTAFFSIALEALQPPDMADVVGKAVYWLSPLGDSSWTVERPVTAPDQELQYTLTARNSGPKLLSGVVLSNTVPLSTTYVVGSLSGPAQYDPVANRFTWHGAMAPGETIVVSYRLHVAYEVPDGATVRNVVHLSDETGLSLNRTAASRVNTPDLSSSVKQVSASQASPGHTLAYSLALCNEGLASASAHLVDPIPPYATYEPGSAVASSGTVTVTDSLLEWAGGILPGQVVSVAFRVTVNAEGAGRYVLNRARLDDGWEAAVPLEALVFAKSRLFMPIAFRH